jgi:hypothetical protein
VAPAAQPPRSSQQPQRGGISITTLVIASIASAAAAYVVSRVWGAGTLFGAAATPVIVALVSEALRRPVEKLPPISVVRPGGLGAAHEQDREPAPTTPDGAPAGRPQPTIVLPHEPPRDPAIVLPPDVPPPGFTAPRRTYSTTNRHRWRLALVTGLAAFAIVAVVYTISDLASGDAVTGRGSSSLFDFSPARHRKGSTTTTGGETTPTGTTTTRTQPAVTQTVTVPADTATPTVTVTTPAATATAPATTTTPPATPQAAPDAAAPATTTPADPAAP